MLQPPPRIAHVITESTPFGGAQRNTLLTLGGLVQAGYEAELLCGPGGPLIEEARAIAVPVHVIPDLIRPIDLLKDWRAYRHLHALFGRRRYDIVHTHSTKAGLLGRLAARRAGVPVVVHTVHGVPFELKRDLKTRLYIGLERLAASVTDCLVCVGETLRQEQIAMGIAPPAKLVTIYSGIDFSTYVPQRSALEQKHQLGLEEAWPIVGNIGRLSQQKAQYDLIEAVARLREKYPRIRLLLVGEGELRPALERQIERRQLASQVSLLGERQDIADLLNIFDVYAASSRWEGVGRALSEAMYWGLPIVTTPVNGVKELIVHEQTGLHVPPGAPGALADAIDRLLSEHTLAKQLGVQAQAKVREIMDSQQMIRAIEALYRQLTRKNMPQTARDFSHASEGFEDR